jgi:hypothetical protein
MSDILWRNIMFRFTENTSMLTVWGIWLLVLISLLVFNEFARRWKWAGFFSFVILPLALSILWFTTLRKTTYTDWFHLAKVYSSTAGCIGFWLIRHLEKKDKVSGQVIWRLADNKIALCFPALIVAINILEACARDIQVGMQYWYTNSGPIEGEITGVLGGPWNYINAAAGILNIFAITGWFGIVIRKKTKYDSSRDMLWPDMLWFYIIAYVVWNFAYTYNCIPTHSFYAGLALLVAPTLCAFTISKGAWIQHRAQTLAIWCMFAQTFPRFQDSGIQMVKSAYNTTVYTFISSIALAVNIAVIIYMIYKVIKTKRNPYTSELYTDLSEYIKVKSMSE